MKKRTLIPAIAAVTIAAMLAGCGSGAANESSQTSTSLSSKVEDLIEAKSSSENTDETAEEETSKDSEAENGTAEETKNESATITGKVKEISSSSVTIEAGEIADGASASDIELGGKETSYEFADDVTVELDMSQMKGGEKPEMPNGEKPEMPNGEKPEMPNGEMPQMPGDMNMTVDRIAADDIVSIEIDNNGKISSITILYSSNMPSGGPGGAPNGSGKDQGGPGGAPGGNSSADINYSGAAEITSAETQSGQDYTSMTADESALLISTSDEVTVEDPTVIKTGDSDGGDNCNFYGLNAAVLVKDGSTTTITGGAITSDASGANGVFCYGGNGGQNGAEGDGTTVVIRDTSIVTTGSGSGGIMTTGGGTTYAYDLDVTTSGQSSAAIRTDRGGGTVVVEGGTYISNGLGSPAIYSTADITVSDATLVSNLSEGVCIEGLNSIELTDCDLTANNTKCNSNATFLDSIMIYQSMSGDAASGTSSFTMNGGSLTSKSGHVFHVTNTNAVITLSGTTILNEDSDNILLSVCDDGWSGGSNTATLNASAQDLSGAVLVGDNSTLTLNLSEGSTFEGYVDGNIKNASGTVVSTEVGKVSVTLDDSSTWTLTGDSYVTEFNGDASNIISNGYTLYVNGTALTGTK